MRVINARNVNEALELGLNLIKGSGIHMNSRNGATIEVDSPVATTYRAPQERVLISKERDANPFFHLMEAMWIIAGRDDVKFLTEFNKRMADYSDDGEIFNAPYGYRLRNHFSDEGKCDLDQLDSVINILKNDPYSRQAVCQIWDTYDLEKDTLDKACNMSIVFRIREGKLNMTVYNRSNDMIWGKYGANVVQFSMIQEYVAAHLDVSIGAYTHVTNSFHVYITGPGGEVYKRLRTYNSRGSFNPYHRSVKRMEIMCNDEIADIEHDIKMFFNTYDQFNLKELGEMLCWQSDYFRNLIMPMLCVYLVYKDNGAVKALEQVKNIKADDWRIAATMWLENRIK